MNQRQQKIRVKWVELIMVIPVEIDGFKVTEISNFNTKVI